MRIFINKCALLSPFKIVGYWEKEEEEKNIDIIEKLICIQKEN